MVAKLLFVAVFFGLCIFVHELGHLLVGLWRGLHVERFSIGFGKRIWGKTIGGVEYIVSILPFGGYVALPQLDPTDIPMTEDGEPLPRAAPGDRALTALAGPVANIGFGFFLALFIWGIGVVEPVPTPYFDVWRVPAVLPLYKDGLQEDDRILTVDGEPVRGPWHEIVLDLGPRAEPFPMRVERDGEEVELTYTPHPNPEYEAGLRPGDRVVAINGKAFEGGWEEASRRIVLNTDDLELQVRRGERTETVRYVPVPNPRADDLGVPFFEVHSPVAVARVMPGTPAEQAGLEAGDILREVNGEPVPNSDTFIRRIAASAGRPLDLTVERDGASVMVEGLQARAETLEDGKTVYRIGIALAAPMALVHPTPWDQFLNVFNQTGRTLGSLSAPLRGKRTLVKPRHLSGPLGILQMIWYRISTGGFVGGLSFIIFISFSLAFFNLLPIPVLDGGHILYAAFEGVTRRRVPTRVVHGLQNAFAILLIGFMLYITFFDIRRIPRFWRLAHPPAEEADRQEADEEPAAATGEQAGSVEEQPGPEHERDADDADRD